MQICRFEPSFFDSIPESPGVYFFLGKSHDILYIGKAKNLRNRVLTHRRSSLELMVHTYFIQWEVHRSEKKAFDRENELLHAIRPPMNIADTQGNHHLFIGFQVIRHEQKALGDVRFLLSGEEGDYDEDFRVFGCFKYRSRTKEAYTALLRLLWAVQFNKRTFSYPSRLTRGFPAWDYTLSIRSDDLQLLPDFLQGRSLKLLRKLSVDLLLNESIPAFMIYSIQEDLDLVHEFFRFGPRFTSQLRKLNQGMETLVSQKLMDQWIEETVSFQKSS